MCGIITAENDLKLGAQTQSMGITLDIYSGGTTGRLPEKRECTSKLGRYSLRVASAPMPRDNSPVKRRIRCFAESSESSIDIASDIDAVSVDSATLPTVSFLKCSWIRKVRAELTLFIFPGFETVNKIPGILWFSRLALFAGIPRFFLLVLDMVKRNTHPRQPDLQCKSSIVETDRESQKLLLGIARLDSRWDRLRYHVREATTHTNQQTQSMNGLISVYIKRVTAIILKQRVNELVSRESIAQTMSLIEDNIRDIAPLHDYHADSACMVVFDSVEKLPVCGNTDGKSRRGLPGRMEHKDPKYSQNTLSKYLIKPEIKLIWHYNVT
jgi:hypothetical protein